MSDEQKEMFEVTEAKRPPSTSSDGPPYPTGDSYEATAFESDDEHPLRARSRLSPETCGCCGGKTKLYRRKLNSGMAAALCWLVANHDLEFAHIAQGAGVIILRNRDYSKLELWGLIEQQRNNAPAKRTSGVWKATPAGKDFALRKTRAASHVYALCPGQKVLGWEATTTNVVEALGEDFNYHELMRGE